MAYINSLQLLLNRKVIFGTDLFQYLSLSLFLSDKSNMHPAIVFRAGKKKKKQMRFTVGMNSSLFTDFFHNGDQI